MTLRAAMPRRDLEQRLSEAEATIAALLSDQIDAVVDRETNTPVLLSTAQAALRESEERYRRIVETTDEGIWTIDATSTVTFANRRIAELFGYSVEEMVGAPLFQFMPKSAAARGAHLDRRERSRAGISEEAEVTLLRRDGTEWWALIKTSPIRDATGHFLGTLGMVTDKTNARHVAEALRRAEERNQQSSKMEAVGQLAAGVAHDFNNLLTVIIGYTELMTAEDGTECKHEEEYREILHAAQSASGLTRQLLAFSRQQVLRATPLDVNALIVNMTGLLRRLIGEHIEIAMALAPALSLACVDRGQLEQVVMNLVVNARDAMPDGGRVTISTLNVDLDDSSLANEAATPGSYVMLAVTDTGTGMAEETHRRLFEPFFTTKEMGKGTGLGLSTTYGIVKQSKGYIGADTKLGSGTTFKVYLPIADEGAAAPVARPAVAAPAAGASATVLLVEDEAGVRRLLKRNLETAGYRVFDAVDGNEAERLFAAHKGTIDLLVTDIIMPRCGGPELYHRLQLQAPALRVLYMSGYTNQSSAQQAEIDAGLPFVQKPFTAAEFEQRVRESLDKI